MPTIVINSPHLPNHLLGALSADTDGVPRYWIIVWLDSLKPKLAKSTRRRYCRHLNTFYDYSEELYGRRTFDRAISDLDFDQIETILSGYLYRLRNLQKHESSGNHAHDIWNTCTAFLFDLLNYLVPQSYDNKVGELFERLKHRVNLYDQLTLSAHARPTSAKVLPAAVLTELCEIFNPNSSSNPFRTEKQRWRNYLIFHLLTSLGVRRSELLLLTTTSVKQDTFYGSNGCQTKTWISIEPPNVKIRDPRHTEPSLKTSFSARNIPVNSELTAIHDTYLRNFRTRSPYPYLLTSRNGLPLSTARVNSVFARAKENLSNNALNCIANGTPLSPHALRHTAAVYRIRKHIDQGDSLEIAVEKLRVFFGWAPTSQMPRLYARAYFESSHQDVWSENFDRFIHGLRLTLGGRSHEQTRV
ncbi:MULTISPECIES: site-specific integrase [Thalassospira]|uniref:Site-specific integrase n=1 Tax=Thalassospira aquimaris TaxID=3037796 RepID=A0ABT6GCJ6_9PROT|nr:MULTISPECIES: site-specific integrase [Thalassospira]MDG4719715.1 site-specific integrase [Thalassospira sp. FZY0004]